MTSPVLHPAARKELDEVLSHIAAESRPAAVRFMERTESTVQLLLDFPDAGVPIGSSVRRFPIRPFPYYVVYAPGRQIRILAIAHERRQPDYWRDRL